MTRGSAAEVAFDTDTPAVVLKLDPNVFHHGGLGVIRSLGRAGIDVYGVHEDLLAPAAWSRYLRGRWYWTPDVADSDRIVAGLLQLAERIGRPAVVIPTDDAGAILLNEHATALRPHFRFPESPAGLPRRLAGKYSLYELCVQENAPHVVTALPASVAEAEQFAWSVGFPLVAKLARPWQARRRHTPRSTTIVHTRQELGDLYRQAPPGGLMLQEYIPGGPGQDWYFHGYCNASSVCEPAFTGVKERSYPPHCGLTSFGRAVPNPQLHRQVTDLLTRIGYRGIMDLDLRFDPRDGQYKLLDFNPRIGAQFRVFQNSAGIDVARAAHLDLTGRPIPTGHVAPGRRLLVENYDTLAALGYLRRGELTVGSWLTTLRRVDETAWFARDDLAPFGLMCLRMAWRMVERPFGRREPTRVTPRFRPGRKPRRSERSPVPDGGGGIPVSTTITNMSTERSEEEPAS
ncbi:MAG: carboxylate--amine ligase [Micromonosporaceae bacterium]|nr:carboxylate--amine ligase [Micromonosporaceae bacterium]